MAKSSEQIAEELRELADLIESGTYNHVVAVDGEIRHDFFTDQQLAEVLRDRIKEVGSQARMAELSGVSQPEISVALRGKGAFSSRLALYLGYEVTKVYTKTVPTVTPKTEYKSREGEGSETRESQSKGWVKVEPTVLDPNNPPPPDELPEDGIPEWG